MGVNKSELRFHAEHLAPGPSANWMREFRTLQEARDFLDGYWNPSAIGGRQEITDNDTREGWLRADGSAEWRFMPPTV